MYLTVFLLIICLCKNGFCISDGDIFKILHCDKELGRRLLELLTLIDSDVEGILYNKNDIKKTDLADIKDYSPLTTTTVKVSTNTASSSTTKQIEHYQKQLRENTVDLYKNYGFYKKLENNKRLLNDPLFYRLARSVKKRVLRSPKYGSKRSDLLDGNERRRREKMTAVNGDDAEFISLDNSDEPIHYVESKEDSAVNDKAKNSNEIDNESENENLNDDQYDDEAAASANDENDITENLTKTADVDSNLNEEYDY